MKLLLDENLPKKLKFRFDDRFEVLTVAEMGWSGLKNGELLIKMKTQNFRILISSDKNMGYQQNLEEYGISLVVLNAPDNRYTTLLEFFPNLEKVLLSEIKIGMSVIEK
ncbi:MAG: DUF5615 family PIN-like protein [Cyclobacteriaceae bacterium]|nr:DUF5615 family PIN-like protein [Cyclobacteriaceae bacterium]